MEQYPKRVNAAPEPANAVKRCNRVSGVPEVDLPVLVIAPWKGCRSGVFCATDYIRCSKPNTEDELAAAQKKFL